MIEFKNGDKVEALFYPEKWVEATYIGRDGTGYVVRTVDGYKCASGIRKRKESSGKHDPDIDKLNTVQYLLNYLSHIDRTEEMKFSLHIGDAMVPIKIRGVDYFNIDFEVVDQVEVPEFTGEKVDWGEPVASGAELIMVERIRQIEKEGFDEKHDDAHADGEIADAAVSYALVGQSVVTIGNNLKNSVTKIQRTWFWPWNSQWFKPLARDVNRPQLPIGSRELVRGRIRDLTKVGALIAAEIDRLQRILAQPEGEKKDGSDE